MPLFPPTLFVLFPRASLLLFGLFLRCWGVGAVGLPYFTFTNFGFFFFVLPPRTEHMPTNTSSQHDKPTWATFVVHSRGLLPFTLQTCCHDDCSLLTCLPFHVVPPVMFDSRRRFRRKILLLICVQKLYLTPFFSPLVRVRGTLRAGRAA